MDTTSIFGTQFFLSLLAWSFTVRLLLGPWLAQKPRHEALLLLSLPHAFRHIGLSFLVPGVVHEALPESFANAAAYGDLLSGLLALLAGFALHKRWSAAIGLTWLLHLVGSLDLLNALRHTEVAQHMGATWFIPTLLVPLLLVTHFLSFRRLLASEPSC